MIAVDSYLFERQALRVFRCNQNDFNGIFSSSSIEQVGGLYEALIVIFGHFYAQSDEYTRNEIDDKLLHIEFFRERRLSDDEERALSTYNFLRDLVTRDFLDN